MINTSIWPMTLLTKPVGEKDRAMITHPKPAVERKGIKRSADGKLSVIDLTAIKIKPSLYYPEFKSAGHRHILARNRAGGYVCYGRRLNVNLTYTDIYPKLERKWKHPSLPSETAVDFELIWPGHPDSEVVTAIKECPEELKMEAFAVPIYRGTSYIGEKSTEYDVGRKLLVEIVGKENCIPRYKPILISDNKVDTAILLSTFLNFADEKKQEGFVLKRMAYDGWWKLKGVCEADVFITGFKVSSAETRKGMVTAVKVSVYDEDTGTERYVGNVSGFNLEEMEQMTQAYEKHKDSGTNPFIKRVLRIVYQEMAGKGGLKHAFRETFREDKGAESCYLSQFGEA